jgi:hypothetical protein
LVKIADAFAQAGLIQTMGGGMLSRRSIFSQIAISSPQCHEPVRPIAERRRDWTNTREMSGEQIHISDWFNCA